MVFAPRACANRADRVSQPGCGNQLSTPAHISNQQRIEIPQGTLGVYPQIGPLPGSTVSPCAGQKPNFPP